MMQSYEQVLDYLYSQLPMYQRSGASALKKDLSNISAIAQVLNHPQRNFKSIHIAGTNGKGSTSHILAALLQANGLKVGLYTSPHYIDFRERIRINGELIPKEEVLQFVNRYQAIFDDIKPSFFEWSVALAFYYFSNQAVDVAIIETGLGGRLDSTNIIHPELSVITNVDLDHQKFLGNNRRAIAREKAGIIKNETPIVIGERHSEYAAVLIEKSKQTNAPIHWAEDFGEVVIKEERAEENHYSLVREGKEIGFVSDLGGGFQAFNFRTAFAAYEILCQHPDFELVLLDQVLNQMSDIRTSTGLLGRWQIINHAPPTILDGAHNDQAIQSAIDHFLTYDAERRFIILGISDDKNIDGLINYLPKSAFYLCCQANVPRAMRVDKLYNKLRYHRFKTAKYDTVYDAYQAAMRKCTEFDAILVTGSIFTTGELLAELKKSS